MDALARQARAWLERLAAGRVYVACLGQFKRGKSTLINALLGEEVLPVGVAPVTNVVTVVRAGPERGARVRRSGGAWKAIAIGDLALYVSEERNPSNQRHVEALEVFHPGRVLTDGICLVDTPGVGSVFADAAEATRAFVPHVDAAIVVIGGDPPLTAEEAELAKTVAEQVENVLVVLNKADKLPEGERAEAKAFAARVLAERLGRPMDGILEVSAKERLTHSGPERDWKCLEAWIAGLRGDRGGSILASAERRAIEVLGGRLASHVAERRRALTRPVEELQSRIEFLRRSSAEAERSLLDLHHLLVAEQERLRESFAKRIERFLDAARPEAKRTLAERIRALDPAPHGTLRYRAHGCARQVCRETMDRFRAEVQVDAARAYGQASLRFVELGNTFLRELGSRTGDALALPPALGAEEGFRVRSRLYYADLTEWTVGGPLRWVLDRIRPRDALLRSVERDAADYLTTLLEMNATRLSNDLDERVLESSRRLEGDVRELLEDVHRSAARALEASVAKRAVGEVAVEAEVRRLDALAGEIDALRGGAGDGERDHPGAGES